jgi:hypothetical protein
LAATKKKKISRRGRRERREKQVYISFSLRSLRPLREKNLRRLRRNLRLAVQGKIGTVTYYWILRLLPKYFKSPECEYHLDPSYESEGSPRHPENEEVFGHLQKLRAARLVVPVGEEHMYFAAMNSKSCRLTALGTFYWHLANSGKI